jgi:hypothetical protein
MSEETDRALLSACEDFLILSDEAYDRAERCSHHSERQRLYGKADAFGIAARNVAERLQGPFSRELMKDFPIYFPAEAPE